MEKVKDKEAEKARRKEDDLEEGLEETFPGSDPAEATQPGRAGSDDEGKDK